MKRHYIVVAVLVFVISAAFVVPRVVVAEDGQHDVEQSEADKKAAEVAKEAAKKEAEKLAEQRKKAEETRREAAKKAAEVQKTEVENEREDVKNQEEVKKEAFKKACESRRESFKTRLEVVASNVQQHTEKLNGLVATIKEYASANNLTPADYDKLLTDIETKKELSQHIFEASKESASGFTCEDHTAAKNSVLNFKDAVSQEVAALKEYKNSVQTLISAVRTAAQANGEK